MRKIVLGIIVALLTEVGFAQGPAAPGSENGNHGDPYFKKWRRAKQELSYRLKSTQVQDLWSKTPQVVLEWLANVEAPTDQERISRLGWELEALSLVINKPQKEKAPGNCLSVEDGNLVVNGAICGNLSEDAAQGLLLKTLIDTFASERDEAFRSYVFLAIARAYNGTIKTPPTGSNIWTVRWYAHKLMIHDYLNNYLSLERNFDSLPPSTTVQVKEWLGENPGLKFKEIANDLFQSKLVFLADGVSNPDGTCAQTSQEPHDDISIAKADCGEEISDAHIMETLIGDTVHHFGKDDNFSDAVGMSVVDSYLNFMEHAAALEGRVFTGTGRGGQHVQLRFTFQNSYDQFKTFVRVQIADLDFLRHLEFQNGSYFWSGAVHQFTCTVEGVGLNEDGKYEYGVLSRSKIDENGSIRVRPLPNGTLRVELSYETHNESCDKKEFKTSLEMRRILPSRVEILANRSAEFRRRVEEHKLDEASEYIRSGSLNPNDIHWVWGRVFSDPTLTPLVELLDIANLTDIGTEPAVYQMLATRNAEHVIRLLSNDKIHTQLKFHQETSDGYDALGYLFSSAFRESFPSLDEYEDFTSKVLPFFIAEKKDLTAAVNSRRYRDLDVFTTALMLRPSDSLVNIVLEKYPHDKVDVVNAYGRRPMDYLFSYWTGFEAECKAVVERSGADNPIRHEFQKQLGRFEEIRKKLTSLGAKPERTGCIYYYSRSCQEENGRLKLRTYTNFETVLPPGVSAKCG